MDVTLIQSLILPHNSHTIFPFVLYCWSCPKFYHNHKQVFFLPFSKSNKLIAVCHIHKYASTWMRSAAMKRMYTNRAYVIETLPCNIWRKHSSTSHHTMKRYEACVQKSFLSFFISHSLTLIKETKILTLFPTPKLITTCAHFKRDTDCRCPDLLHHWQRQTGRDTDCRCPDLLQHW